MCDENLLKKKSKTKTNPNNLTHPSKTASKPEGINNRIKRDIMKDQK